eukprot:TRINITY_DN47108_c0_g1_i1.p1 TRINITY_DN47108_c0_g1~~TRINITY_DN47108_c0_g1_i1.p1  ORF type:complete len:226 (+),score=51.43 TRINITY_DN47108_c0_g1_i1:104-781(+)
MRWSATHGARLPPAALSLVCCLLAELLTLPRALRPHEDAYENDSAEDAGPVLEAQLPKAPDSGEALADNTSSSGNASSAVHGQRANGQSLVGVNYASLMSVLKPAILGAVNIDGECPVRVPEVAGVEAVSRAFTYGVGCMIKDEEPFCRCPHWPWLTCTDSTYVFVAGGTMADAATEAFANVYGRCTFSWTFYFLGLAVPVGVVASVAACISDRSGKEDKWDNDE